MRLPEGGGVVTPSEAWLIVQTMRPLARRGAFDRMNVTQRDELLTMLDCLEEISDRARMKTAKSRTRAAVLRSKEPGRIGVPEAAEVLGVGRVWMGKRARRGEFDAVKVDGKWHLSRAQVLDEADRRREEE
ncbi:MAG TPA: hypothetical protein VFU43_25280 [Streptosporangiaceae bacterium]|nr:hypothetical protein [Streptosporangiaceae bacterium]